MNKNLFSSFALIAGLILFTNSLNAQDYKSAIGLRLGIYNGVTFKTNLSETGALEFFGTARFASGFRWLTVTGLYEYTQPIKDVDGMRWYVGGGLSAFNYSYDFSGTSDGFTTFGITGIAGIEYTLKEAPINFSLDWSPTFLFKSEYGFTGNYFALSARYVIGRN